MGYIDFLSLVQAARFVITDSGGVQEETTFLGVPCLTLRTTTERPVTIERGSNILAGEDPRRLHPLVAAILSARASHKARPRLWDGHSAERIAAVLSDIF